MVHHGGSLRRLTGDQALTDQLVEDYASASITAQDLVMLRYVEKVTTDPSSVTGDDADSLRAGGFSDSEILDICQVAAYFAFVNRLASGLGVELEE